MGGGYLGAILQPPLSPRFPHPLPSTFPSSLSPPLPSPPPPQGMLEAAVADYSTALTLNPQHSRAHFNRGFCFDGLNRVEEALLVCLVGWG